jgi:hypothetical protein
MSLHSNGAAGQLANPAQTCVILPRNQRRERLTDGLDVAILIDLGLGGRHLGDVAAGVPGHAEVEPPRLLGALDAVRGELELADGHLERAERRRVALRHRRQHAAAAAVGHLDVVGRAGWQVHDGGAQIAAVRGLVGDHAPAVALLRGLRAARIPDHLLARPIPAQTPPQLLDVACR